MVYLTSVIKVMNTETGGIPYFSNKGIEMDTETSGFDRADKNDKKNTYPGSSNSRNTFLSQHSLRSRWALRYNISSHHVKVPSKLYIMIIIRPVTWNSLPFSVRHSF